MSNVKLQGNVSGTGSVTITSPNTNSDRTITLPDSSGTFVVDGASQSPTFNAVTTTTLSVAGNNISAVNGNWRNRIQNGCMRIDQRNAGASVTGNTGVFPVDRWSFNNSQSSKFTAQRNAGSVTPPAGFTNYLGVTSSSAYSLLSGDYFAIGQNIEGFNTADLGYGAAGAQTVTVSFWVRSSLTGTFSFALTNNAYARGYVATYTISSANTWEFKTVTIPGDTTGTWLSNNEAGIRLFFNLGAGSTQNATPNTWGSWVGWGVSGAQNVVGTNGATFYITGVQLEAGSVASPFERRDYGRELIMCQRYYQSIPDESIVFTATVNYSSWLFPVTMRATPTVTIIGSTNGTQAVASTTTNGFFATNTGTTGCGYTAAAEL